MRGAGTPFFRAMAAIWAEPVKYAMLPAMTRDEVLAKLRAIKPDLEKEYGIKRLRLFGSHARNEAGDESDIDLIVDLGRPLGLDFFGLEMELAERLGRKVDLATPGALHRVIKDRVLAEAIDV